MSIFPNLEIEPIVQINDKTRLNATRSFVSKDSSAITKVEIRPSADSDYVNVTGTSSKDWYLDWQYSECGIEQVSILVTIAGDELEYSELIHVLSQEEDSLWSSDKDLVGYEPDILKYLIPGKNSYINIHRKAQNEILDWFDEQRIYDKDGERLTKSSILKTDDLKRMSVMKSLQIIFDGISNKPDDVFSKKAEEYNKKFLSASERGRIRFDFNKDGEQGKTENVDNMSMRISRRG